MFPCLHLFLHFILLGYIEEIKNLMFSKSVQDFKETIPLSNNDVPDPITSQFTERKSRADTVAHNIQRRSRVTQLYPTGGFGA